MDSCQDDLGKAAEKFTEARLSDVHALYQMDRNSRSMSGKAFSPEQETGYEIGQRVLGTEVVERR